MGLYIDPLIKNYNKNSLIKNPFYCPITIEYNN